MGHYSELYIDKLLLSWKYDIPAFLSFLFDKEDFYKKFHPDDEDYFEEIGYETTCKKSLNVLKKYGYDIDFFTEIYQFFYNDLVASYEDYAKDQIAQESEEKLNEFELSDRLDKHTSSFPKLARKEELEDFIQFLSSLLCSDFEKPPFDEPYTIKLQDGNEYKVTSEEYLRSNKYRDVVIIDFEALQMYVLDKHLKFPPWILALCRLFDDDYFFEYPEIISLMFIFLALSAVRPRSHIKLELSDIADDEDEVRSLHINSANSLVEKVNLYNRVFETLFTKEENIRNRFIKTECEEIFKKCTRERNKSRKGKLLERLTEILFTSNNAFELVDKRVSTGDEEIDLVIKNNIDRPFWISFGSPLFFIECKNWSSQVGTKELRDFEIKLQNHAKLAKVGFFVSLNGFTSQVFSELKRLGRDEYHIVLIKGDDIKNYLSSKIDFFEWLEQQTSKFY
jgi:hypothetical protein